MRLPAARPLRRNAALRMLLPVLIALAVLAGCSDDDPSPRPADEGSSTTAAPATGDPGESSAPPPAADLAAPVELVDLELDLDAPIAAAAVPGSNSVLVAERSGRLHEMVLEDGAARLVDGPLLDLRRLVGSTSSERGMLGVAVAPEGDVVVVSYTAAANGANHLDRYVLDGEPGQLSIDPDTGTNLLRVEQPFPNHNGGHVTFGPDGMLYAGIGDGGSSGDPQGNGQDRSTLLGKLLRLDPRPGADLVPPDNPFAGSDDGSRPEIWLTGVRNPWRFSFDAATGDLWVADVGQNAWEEIDHLPAADGAGRGANLGWDLYEGREEYDEPDPAPKGWSDGPFVEPVHTYGRDDGCSITGGLVHDGRTVPSLAGAFLFADYCGDTLRALVVGGGEPQVAELRGPSVPEVVSFAEGPGGEVLVLSLSDGVFVLRPA